MKSDRRRCGPEAFLLMSSLCCIEEQDESKQEDDERCREAGSNDGKDLSKHDGLRE